MFADEVALWSGLEDVYAYLESMIQCWRVSWCAFSLYEEQHIQKP